MNARKLCALAATSAFKSAWLSGKCGLSRRSPPSRIHRLNGSTKRLFPSYLIEAATGCDEAPANAERINRTMLLDRRYTGTIGLDTAGDVDFTRRTTGLYAQADSGKTDDDAFDQRWAGAAERLDAAAHDELPDRLADLNAHGSVCVRGDPVEFGKVHRAGIDVEAACALAERFDRRVHFQFVNDPEIHEADAARAVRGDLLLGDPAIDDAPIVEHHVVDAVGRDRATIPHDINMSAVHGEDAAGDLVRRARRDLTVAIDSVCFQASHGEPPALVAGAAHKDAAP